MTKEDIEKIINGALILAVYAGQDWYIRKIKYGVGADSSEYLDKYIEGGMKLKDKFGKDNFLDYYQEYFEKEIKPQ